MTNGRILAAVAIGLVLLVVLGGGCVYSGYTTVIEMDEAINSRWAQVENQLQRRYDLIPNLVETVKGVAGQEQEVFLGIAEARKAYFQAEQVPDKAQAAAGLERALSRLLLLREAYPELRSNESFLKLQDQLEGTENRLSVERKRYNDAVQTLNTYIRKPLGRLYAGLAGVDQAEYFEIAPDVREAPQVEFSGDSNMAGRKDQNAAAQAGEESGTTQPAEQAGAAQNP